MPGRPPRNKQSLPSLFPDIFYQQNAQSLGEAELVIADLTEPDYKTGFLISQALNKNIPVLGLYADELGELKEIDGFDENFYSRSFNKENIRSVLRHFLRSLKTKRTKRGKFVVFEGIGGCGKSTQFDLIQKYLKKKKIIYKVISFPRYKSSFHGQTVRKYLNGEFGEAEEISPYLSSLPYALDRLMAKKEMVDWLSGGCLLLADRYTGSNMAYQSAYFSEKEKKKFVDWLEEIEYNVHLLPKEDLVIYLDIALEKSLELRRKRKSGDTDILEDNKDFFEKVLENYRWLVDQFDHWVKVDCLDSQGKLLSR
jgi:dTMP kinase